MTTSVGQERVKDLENLFLFAESKIINNYSFQLGKHRARKGFVFQYTGAAHGLVRSILELLKTTQTNSATILLRTIFEVYVRLVYLFCAKGQQNVLKGAIESFRGKINGTKNLEKFLNDNPHFKGVIDVPALIHMIPEWEKYKKRAENMFAKRYGTNNYEMPKTLKGIVKEIDEWNNITHPSKNNKNNLMWNYLTVYWLWSLNVHLDMDGLNSYMENGSNGWQFLIEGHPDEVEKIAVTTYALYFNILKIFSDQFGVPTITELKPYKERLKSSVKRP